MVPAGRDVVVIFSEELDEADAIVIDPFALADCGVVAVESVTVNETGVVPTELCAGVPVMAPFERLMASPPGKPFAL